MGFDVKKTTKISVLDLLMPYTCRGCGRLGSLLCECCKKNILQPECKDGWIYAVGRREGVLMQLVEDYKYKSIRKTALVLAELMDRALLQIAGGHDAANASLAADVTTAGILPIATEIVVVPLPTISKHIRERGFDHTLNLARVLAKRRGWECCSLLSRVNKTVQVGSDAEVRKRQAKEAYTLATGRKKAGRFGACNGDTGGRLFADKTYLLVDDVSTTGASLEAARGVLFKNGAKRVLGAVVCVGLSDD